jgi:hypothetical protein
MQVKSPLSTPWRRMGGVELKLHSFLASAPDGGEWSTSRPVRFTPGTHRIEDGWIPKWVWTFWRRENLLLLTGFAPRTVQPVAWSLYRLHYSGSERNPEVEKKWKLLLTNMEHNSCVTQTILLVNSVMSLYGVSAFSWPAGNASFIKFVTGGDELSEWMVWDGRRRTADSSSGSGGYKTVSEGDAANSPQSHLQIGDDNRFAFCPQSFADFFSQVTFLDHLNPTISLLCKDNCYSTDSKCQQLVFLRILLHVEYASLKERPSQQQHKQGSHWTYVSRSCLSH